ncbi:MAG: FCSD flavin-binding domain-containing protein, partial [Luteimonas sp.]|nr:FCSD flavin-binding domain-containing protein [Luteimonas sp.]
ADLVCAIPAQRAADLCQQADLADGTGWCPVSGADFRSLRHPGVYVIGDAAIAQPMPKSAFAANSQAKLCALALLADLAGRPAPEPRLLNTCYSLVAPEQAISVSGRYGLAGDRLSALSEGTSPVTGDDALREREAVDAAHWYRSIVADSFGQAP